MKKKEINYQLLIRRICLIVLDIICIIAASILALLTRFEFDFSQIPKEFLKVIYKYGPFTIVITLIIFSLFRIYSSLWEYAGIEEVFSLIAACLAAAVAKIVIILFTWSVMPRSWYVLDTIYLMILIGATRVSYRLIRLRRQNRTFPWSKRKKVMIIGGGEAGRSLITEIQNSKYLDQKVVCIIDDDPYKIGRYIKGVKVVGNRNSIKKSVKKYNVQQIILTIPSANAAKIRPIVEICQDTNCELMILPGVYQLVNGEVKASKLRPVNIDDLLGRDEVHVNLNEVMDYVSGRVIMVTGGGGSIGSELCRQIAKHSPKQLIIFDIYENNAYDIQQELLREQPKLDLVVRSVLYVMRTVSTVSSNSTVRRSSIMRQHISTCRLWRAARTRLSRIMSSELIIWSEWQINGMLRDLYRYLQIRLSTQRISWELPRESVR